MRSASNIILPLIILCSLCYALVLTPSVIDVDVYKIQKHAYDFEITNLSTAVLLNFRAYDTFLEIGVMALTLFGIFGLSKHDPKKTRLNGHYHPILRPLTVILSPLMFIMGAYLLWAGTSYTGGAFQAGAIWASAGILLFKSGELNNFKSINLMMLLLSVLSFLLFIIVGWLFYAQFNYAIIFLLEFTIAVSTAATFVYIFAFSNKLLISREDVDDDPL